MLRTSLVVCTLIALGLLVATPAGARPHPTPTPSATPTPPPADPAVTKLARQQFLAWQIGSIEKSLYDPRLLAQLTDAKIADTSKAIAPLGALIDTVYVGPFTGSDFPPDAKGYVYQMTCTQGKMYEFVVLTGEGKIATMFFRDTLTTEEITGPAVHSPPPPTAKP